MRVFLAGGIAGNLNPFWHGTCRRLERGLDYSQATEEEMKVFLAGVAPWRSEGIYDKAISEYDPYILESFYYADSDTERLLPYFGDFLLDSGAFTFMEGKGGAVNWDDYVERYAEFVRRNKVKKYFELDIDLIVGYERVKEIRRKLETLVGWPSIPVWHSNRGVDDFRRMCDEYEYVAMGGIVGKKWKKSHEKYVPAFIKEAHNRGAKIHGLGFTRLTLLPDYHFDSVDSTAWTTGNRYGFVYYFDGKTMKKIDAPAGHRIGASREAAVHNFTEWLKFQKYAEGHL